MVQLRNEQRPTERLKRHSRSVDRFHIPPEIIPEGMTYEWKRLSVFGQEDRQHQLHLKRNHWREVPASRHPDLFGDSPGPAIVDGLVLMEREAYLTKEARDEDYANATSQLQNQMARLDQIQGIGPDSAKFRPPSTISKQYERTAVPDDE